MDGDVQALFVQGVSPSTLAAYSSGIRRYSIFCKQFRLQPLPLSDTLLCRFVAVLHRQELSPSTVRLYLSSLRFLQISQGEADPSLANFPQLHYVIKAVRRSHPISRRPTRLPITPTILRHLYSVWSTLPVTHDKCMLWAACCLGFFCLSAGGGVYVSLVENVYQLNALTRRSNGRQPGQSDLHHLDPTT